MKAVKADTTIGMVTYNRLDLTKETFARALQKTGKPFNLVICDNNSSDETREWIKEAVKDLPNIAGFAHRFLPENKGIAYGRNICLKVTKNVFPETKYICTLDNDVAIPNKTWLKDCCDVLDVSDKHGCCAVNFEKKPFPQTTLKTKDGRDIKVKIIINTPGTACTVFKQDVVDKLGYFKRYAGGVYGHEDANWFVRVRLLGKILFYLDESGIHLGEGEVDTGEYRDMKTKVFNENRHLFVEDMHAYSRGTKSLYLDFKEEE